MIHAGVLLIPSFTVCILLVSSSIGFLISFTVFFTLENSGLLFFFFFFNLVLCSPFPWHMFCLFQYIAHNYFIF